MVLLYSGTRVLPSQAALHAPFFLSKCFQEMGTGIKSVPSYSSSLWGKHLCDWWSCLLNFGPRVAVFDWVRLPEVMSDLTGLRKKAEGIREAPEMSWFGYISFLHFCSRSILPRCRPLAFWLCVGFFSFLFLEESLCMPISLHPQLVLTDYFVHFTEYSELEGTHKDHQWTAHAVLLSYS